MHRTLTTALLNTAQQNSERGKGDQMPTNAMGSSTESMKVADLQAGDIVFFRTTANSFMDFDAKDFDRFPVLAGFSQSLPYALASPSNAYSSDVEIFKPWHHVAVCVQAVESGGTAAKVVDFGQNIYEPIPTNSRADLVGKFPLGERDLVDVADQRIDVLRSPDEALRDKVVAGAQKWATDGTHYELAGLGPFALATRGRWEPAGPYREDLLNLAYGANVVVAKETDSRGRESCTTWVAQLIRDALGGRGRGTTNLPLKFAEPPAPPLSEMLSAFADQNSIVNKAILALTRHSTVMGEGLARGALKDLDAAQVAQRLPLLRDHIAAFDLTGPINVDAMLAAAKLEHRRALQHSLAGTAWGQSSVTINGWATSSAATPSALGLGRDLVTAPVSVRSDVPTGLPAEWATGVSGRWGDQGGSGPIGGRGTQGGWVPRVWPPEEPIDVVLPPDDSPLAVPGPDGIDTTAQYIAILELATELVFNDKTPAQSVAHLGAADRARPNSPGPEHLVLSPAMLWDALIQAPFVRVIPSTQK